MDKKLSEHREDVRRNAFKPVHLVENARRLLAELLGTFALTFVAAGGDVISAVSHEQISVADRVVAPALIVMGLIYTVGNLSGAHFNPAVTLAFALRRDFPWRRVPAYWITQLVGAVLAALLLRFLFGLAGNVGTNSPHYGILSSFIMEIVLTFFLITVILGTATNHRVTGTNAALAVGGAIALDGLFAQPISGASMKPARSLGPALVSGHLGNSWIYIVAPCVGAILASFVAWLLRGRTTEDAKVTAQGDQ
jgi:aquaporin Z